MKRVTFPAAGAGGATGPMTVTLETASGETSDVSCRLLVAADGGDSKASIVCGVGVLGQGECADSRKA